MNRMHQPMDPYRLLFPLGLFLGIIGVLLWPLFVYGLWPDYPAVMHARIMIAGFGASFVLGFMGTALPHMLETRGITRIEGWTWATGLLTASALHLFHQTVFGDLVFAAVLILFLGGMAWRWPRRKDMPPPGAVGAGLGLLCGLTGALIQALGGAFNLSPFAYLFSKLLLYQGLLLLPVLGIGAFILPVFIGYPRQQTVPPARLPSRAWRREAGIVFTTGGILILSFALEAAGSLQPAYILRTVILLAYFARYLPAHRTHKIPGALSWMMRLALLFIAGGYVLAATWTAHYMAWLHVVFMTGFGLLIFAVAGRVILGHGGRGALFTARWPSLWIVAGLIILAMLTRVSADWMPDTRLNHYAYAAMCWIPAATLWGVKMFRYILDQE